MLEGLYNYTEPQKKTSFLQGDAHKKSTPSKLIVFGTQISFNTPLIRISEKHKIFLASKRRKMRLNHER